jgi:hypothetical protein
VGESERYRRSQLGVGWSRRKIVTKLLNTRADAHETEQGYRAQPPENRSTAGADVCNHARDCGGHRPYSDAEPHPTDRAYDVIELRLSGLRALATWS